MKKVLISVGGFFPAVKYGGPSVSIENLCNLLDEEYKFYIVTRNHDLGDSNPLDGVNEGWNIHGKSNVLYLADDEITYSKYMNILDEIKPELIYINSIFDAKMLLPLMKAARKQHVRVLLAPRGELCENAFRKKYKKIPYLWLLKKYWGTSMVEFHSTSTEESNAIHALLNVDFNRIHLLSNVPTIPRERVIHYNKRVGDLSIVFLARIHPKKNLLFAIECLSRILEGKIKFDIYGPIEDKEYWNKCLLYIKRMPPNISVTYRGTVLHQDVHDILKEYELFFFPTLSENYGHVIAEALFAGLPILISDQTPWTDVEDYHAGKAVSLINENEFVEFIKSVLNCDSNEFAEMSDNALRYVAKKNNIEELKACYEGVFTSMTR